MKSRGGSSNHLGFLEWWEGLGSKYPCEKHLSAKVRFPKSLESLESLDLDRGLDRGRDRGRDLDN